MGEYVNSVTAELKKSWWNTIVVIVFTIARLIFGWAWFFAGWDKMTVEHWLSDGKFNSGGLIQGMVASIQHSHGPDPLHINNLLVWLANNIFLHMGGLVDFLVVALEILIGLFIFFGFGFVWTIAVAIFLNLQYIAAGSANNFGYLVTDIIWLRFPSYASLIGVDGYIRFKKGQNLLGFAGVSKYRDSNHTGSGGSYGASSKI